MSARVSVSGLLWLLDSAYDRTSWHGPNLRGALRGVSLPVATWRPAPGRHNVWEILVHAAYWKYAAWRRLTGAPRGSFPLAGSNWFVRPQRVTAQAWTDDLALLDAMHRPLREAIAAGVDRDLETRLSGSRVTQRALITGIAAHDLYHAGQIQLLKRLAPRRRPTGRMEPRSPRGVSRR
jgi:hypothetical protein